MKLKDIGKIVTGKTPSTKQLENFSELADKYLFVTPRDMKDNCKYIESTERYLTSFVEDKFKSQIIKKDSVCISCIGSDMGKVYMINRPGITNQQINSITDIKDICNPHYLYYYFSDKKEYLKGIAGGSTMPILNKSTFENIEIDLPARNIQDKIVKILNNIDNKIELNNQTNDNLYDMCNVIFHNYLDKYSEQVEYTKIVDIVDRVVTGKTPSTKNEEFWNGDIPFITIPDMHNQIFTIDTERTISGVGAKSIIPGNSISVSCIATVGLVSISTKKSQTNQQINSIVLKNDYDLYYLFEFLSEQESFMKNIAGGSTTYNINKTTFENIEVPYLPQNIIQEFHNTVCKLFDKIKLNQLENKNLEQLRDTLLPKLMNGEIDLDKIEI